MSENMTYKATLYDTWYNGKVNVTAVSDTILSDAAAQMQLGGMLQCRGCRKTNPAGERRERPECLLEHSA